MTYRVEFQPPALRQLNGFPGGALDALVSAMADRRAQLLPADPGHVGVPVAHGRA
jgi:hypothetical protein